MISAPLKLKAWTTGRTTAPVVSRRVSPKTTEGDGRVSNWIDRTDVELPLKSVQATAPTIETAASIAAITKGRERERRSDTGDGSLIPTDRRVSWRDSRTPETPRQRDSALPQADQRQTRRRSPRCAGPPHRRRYWRADYVLP